MSALNWRTQEETGKQQRPVGLIADKNTCRRQKGRRILERDFCVVEAATGEADLTCPASNEYKMAAVILSMALSEAAARVIFHVVLMECLINKAGG